MECAIRFNISPTIIVLFQEGTLLNLLISNNCSSQDLKSKIHDSKKLFPRNGKSKYKILMNSIFDNKSQGTFLKYNRRVWDKRPQCRRKQWAQRTGKSTSAPKLCTLPPTTEGHPQNTLRAHHQLCNWYFAMEIDPPEMNSLEYGYEADHINKIVTPRPLPEGVRVAPDEIMEKIRCGCAATQPCKGGKCTCHNKKKPCTMFCGCSDGDNCCNPFRKQHKDHSDSEDDDDEI